MENLIWQDIVGIIAGLLIFLSYLFYIKGIVSGQTKPNRASWLMLTAITVGIFLTYKEAGADQTLYAALGTAVGTTLVMCLSLWYSRGSGWSRFELYCGLATSLCLLLYHFYPVSPLTALGILLFMDIASLAPTMVHAVEKPHEEDTRAWSLTVFGDLLAVAALNTWAIGVVVYPVYMVAINGIVLMCILSPVTRRWFSEQLLRVEHVFSIQILHHQQ